MSPSPTALASAGAGNATAAAAGARSSLEHAYLQLYEPSKDGSLAKAGAPLERIEFQFNPKELTLGKSANWARSNSKGDNKSGPPQYNGPQPSKLTLEMFLDASASQGSTVVTTVEKLFTCCVPTASSLQQKKASPPWVVFRWGTLTGFLSYISSVQAKYTLFTSGGLPIRATCTVTLDELSGDAPRQNPTSGGLRPQRVHTLVAGETLPALAYEEYGDPALWRAIAQANAIDDPMRLRPGTDLLLPTGEDIEDTRVRPTRRRHNGGEVAHAAR